MKRTKELNTNKGITLIALVITIIVMLILVAVTINMAVNGGLFDYAGKATGDTQNAIDEEQALANGKVHIDGVWYNSIDEYINNGKEETPYLGLTITSDTEGVVYTDKDGNTKELTEAVEDGDIIIYGDYEYRYNYYYDYIYDDPDWYYAWVIDTDQNGWGVLATDNTKSIYGELCGSILGKTVNTLGGTFENCTNLINSPQIPNTIQNINRTFKGCTSITVAPEIPNSVTIIGRNSFSFCTGLKEIIIPEGVTLIGNSAFSGCESLTDILIPDSVDTIMETAFSGCNGLTKIIIPEGMTLIGYRAFSGCGFLTVITYNGTIAQWRNVTLGNDWADKIQATTVQCSDGTVNI